jgi:hypothetical protein
MTRKIDSYHPVVFGEDGNLVVPEMAVAAPTMDEYKCRLAFALDSIVNGNTIAGGNNVRANFKRCERKNER